MDQFMAFWIFFIGIAVGFVFCLAFVSRTALSPLHEKVKKLKTNRSPFHTLDGEFTEQFERYMKDYPYSLDNFRYIGTPVDGLQFEEDQILFVEFKIDEMKPTDPQFKIKKLIEAGKIKWYEFKMSS